MDPNLVVEIRKSIFDSQIDSHSNFLEWYQEVKATNEFPELINDIHAKHLYQDFVDDIQNLFF